ncbi:MAG: PIG-L family deacetylase, partial [Candidatus Latescibacterota bacterium]
DFGYSKTAEETFDFWDRNTILADVVRVIRTFRPDVIVTRFPPGQSGGHGHHTASTALAFEAFRAAADPAQFPEQLTFVKPWKTRRFFSNSFRSGQPEKGVLRVNVGEYNPLLGKSYNEIAALSRSMHKTQGFGSAGRRGVQYDNFELVEGEPAAEDIFQGIDTSWNRVPGGSRIGEMLREVMKAFDPRNPSQSVPALIAVHEELKKLPGDEWVAVKQKEVREVIQSCAGLWIEAVADGFSAAPGEDIPIRITLVNRSPQPFRLEKIECPACGFSSDEKRGLADNTPVTVQGALRIPASYPISQPYWLEKPFSVGMFAVSDQRMIGVAENAPAVLFPVTVSCGGNRLEYPVPLVFRWTDRAEGELYRPFEIRPPVTVQFDENVCVFANKNPKKITVRIKSHISKSAGSVRLKGPAAWKVTPESIPFSIDGKDGEQQVTFTLSPPEGTGEAVLVAEADLGGKRYDRAIVEITHPHIKKQVYFPPSALKAVKIASAAPGGSIGYIMGSGDEIPESLRSLGYDVTLLDDRMIGKADFAEFDAVITGVRAYNIRGILKQVQPRLLEYVRSGGTLIVQYNVPSGLLVNNIGPYPFTPGNDRVCVEKAPVGFIHPDHPLLNF